MKKKTPIIRQPMSSVGVTRICQGLEQKIQSISSFIPDQYMTEKSIVGIIVLAAKEGSSIHGNPAVGATELYESVFGNNDRNYFLKTGIVLLNFGKSPA